MLSCSTHTKKAWESLPPLVPHFEALALPNQSEQATQKPTPVCISHHWHTLYIIIRCTSDWRLHTHGDLPLPCSLTDLKLAIFRSVKNKASSKRLHHIYVPHSQAAPHEQLFPPSADFCFGGRLQGQHPAFVGRHQPIRFGCS